jgi:hypothetical protein
VVFIYVEFYSAMKKNEMSFTGKWMERENINLSEVSQVQKDKGCTFSLICRRWIQSNTNITIYTYKYIQNMFPIVELLEETKGGEKEE